MAEEISIVHLYQRPKSIRMVAEWIYTEFWTEKANMSADILEGWLRDADSQSAIPLSWLALVDNVPAGTVNLIENDNSERPDLTPWAAALLVRPAFRKRGIGTLLMRTVTEGARQLGNDRLYLGTDIPAFYERLGWRILEQVHPGYCIMTRNLSPK